LWFFYIVHLYNITQQRYFNKKVNFNVKKKKTKEDKLYKFFLPTLEQILDLLFFSIELMRQLITVGQASFVFCLQCHSLALLRIPYHGKSFSILPWCQAATNVSDTRDKHLPFLHGRKLYPAIKSGVVSADKIRTVFSCKDIFETLKT